MKTTRKQLNDAADYLKAQGADIRIEYLYGQPVCLDCNGQELSPRLPLQPMKAWLAGFEKGWQSGREYLVSEAESLYRPRIVPLSAD